MNTGNERELDILMSFSYEDNDYVIITDNTYDDEGNFNMYGAKLGPDNRLEEVVDRDVISIFDSMIKDYKEKILRGDFS